MSYLKNIVKNVVIKFSPFVSRHKLLKQVILFFLNLFPRTKEKIVNYKKNFGNSVDYKCFLKYGFAPFEESGVWSIEPSCGFVLLSPSSSEKDIKLEMTGIFFQQTYIANIFINSEKIAKWFHGNGIALTLPREFYPAGEKITVTIEIPNIKSPFDLGISEDKRTLGVFLQTIKINGVVQTLSISSIFTKKAHDIYINLMKKIDQKRGCNAHNT